MRVHGADGFAAGSSIEANANRVVVYSLITKNILARLQEHVTNLQGGLRDKEMRVLTFGRISGGDQHHAGDEFPAPVRYARGCAELCFDVLFNHGGPRGNQFSQFNFGGGAPTRTWPTVYTGGV